MRLYVIVAAAAFTWWILAHFPTVAGHVLWSGSGITVSLGIVAALVVAFVVSKRTR